MTPDSYATGDIPENHIKRQSDSKITAYEWYCKHCQKWVGWPELNNTAAEICDDATECPHSVEWGGDACGHVVCEWCHEPAADRIRTFEQKRLWLLPKAVKQRHLPETCQDCS